MKRGHINFDTPSFLLVQATNLSRDCSFVPGLFSDLRDLVVKFRSVVSREGIVCCSGRIDAFDQIGNHIQVELFCPAHYGEPVNDGPNANATACDKLQDAFPWLFQEESIDAEVT